MELCLRVHTLMLSYELVIHCRCRDCPKHLVIFIYLMFVVRSTCGLRDYFMREYI